MNRYYVYSYAYPDGTPYYIGKGSGRRHRVHLCDAKAGRNTNKYAVRVTAKIIRNGAEPVVTIIREGLSNDEACALEVELIAHYGRRDIGTGCLTNGTDGGDKGAIGLSDAARALQVAAIKRWTLEDRVVDAEYRERISEGVKDHYRRNPVPEQRRVKLSKRMSGEGNPMSGQKHSADARRKISEAHAGVSLSEDHRLHISEALAGTRGGEQNPFHGRKHTTATRQRIGEASVAVVERLKEQGKPHWNEGRTLTPEHVEKLRVERVCPRCGKVGRGSAMKRYHMDNCKAVV